MDGTSCCRVNDLSRCDRSGALERTQGVNSSGEGKTSDAHDVHESVCKLDANAINPMHFFKGCAAFRDR